MDKRSNESLEGAAAKSSGQTAKPLWREWWEDIQGILKKERHSTLGTSKSKDVSVCRSYK